LGNRAVAVPCHAGPCQRPQKRKNAKRKGQPPKEKTANPQKNNQAKQKPTQFPKIKYVSVFATTQPSADHKRGKRGKSGPGKEWNGTPDKTAATDSPHPTPPFVI
jgi:hypothetical protein